MFTGEHSCDALHAYTDVRRGLGRVAPLFAALSLLTGCATTQTTLVDGRVVDSSDLYSGEPVAMHATEMPVGTAEEARSRARAALAERDIDLALYLLVQAVALDPEDTQSLFAVGAIQEERGNLDPAARAYARIIELQPDNALAHQGLGIVLFEAREFAAAEAPLRTSIGLDPTLWRASNTLGILADRGERYAEAIGYYTAALAAQPMLASVRNNRGYSKYLAGDLAAAKVDFLAALEIDTEYDRAWRNLGLVLAREQNYARALDAMTHAIDKHVALNDIGYIAMLDGNLDLASRYFEQAIHESPRHYQTAQDNLTELNRRRNVTPAALVAVD
jgi:Flp pilus assembly protein TadD